MKKIYKRLPKKLQRPISMIGMLLLFLTVGSFVYLFGPWGKASAVWFDDNWAYRKSIAITGHTAAENNVYITLSLDTSTLISAGQMQSDCGDLRYTTYTGEVLAYYIVSGCNSGSTSIHVNFDSFPAGAQTIYYYYGNPSAQNGFSPSDFASAASNVTIGSTGSEEKTLAPALYYRFDEGTGTTTKDSSSSKNNGTITNGTWQTEDLCMSGKCLSYNGSSTQVLTANYPKASSTITVAAWVYATSRTTWATIAKNWGVSAGGAFHFGLENTSGDLSVYITQSNDGQVGPVREGSGNPFPLNSWQYVAFVADGSNVKLYRNGNVVASASYNGTLKTSINCLGIGAKANDACNAADSGYWNGKIDDVKIYNYALSQAQLNANYNSKTRSSVKGASVMLGSDPDANLANNLSGYWKMDEQSWTNNCSTQTVLDSSSNGNNGISCPNGSGSTTPGAGKFGNAGTFDGSNDYVRVTDTASLRSANLTVAGWFKVNSVNNTFPNLVDKESNSTDRNYTVFVNQADNYLYGSTSFNGVEDNVNTGVAVNDSQWHHYAYTINSLDHTQKIYLDGVLKSTKTHAAAPDASTTNDLYIGDDHGSQNFNGWLDETRIYNRTLSPDEISQLYNFAPGPVGYWKLDENGGNTAFDSSSYGNNGTLTNNPKWTMGKVGGGLNVLEANTQYVSIPDSDSLDSTGALTLEAWIKPTANDLDNGYADIVGKGDSGASNTSYSLSLLDSDTLSLWWGTAGSYADWQISGTTLFTAGQWYHVVATRNSTLDTVYFYVNGVRYTASNTGSNVTPGGASNGVAIGRPGEYTGQYFDGIIDDVKIYNYVRTSGQVSQDMNANHPTVGGAQGSPLAYWKFDDGSGTTASNAGSDGNNSKGTLTNMSSPATSTSGWTQSGKFGKAINFDGTNDYVNMGSAPALKITGDLTLSAWVNLTTNNAVHDIISKKGASGQFSYRLHTDANGKLTMEVSGSGSNTFAATSSASLSSSTWYHVVGVYTAGNSIKLYINGRADGSSTTAIPSSIFNSTSVVNIGAENNGASNLMSGVIDEPKIYSGALSQANVLIDYNRSSSQVLGALSDNSSYEKQASNQQYCVPGDTASCAGPLAEWNLDEKTGSSVFDTSGTNDTGTWHGSTPFWKPGKIGTAGNFNGTNNFVSFASANNVSIKNTTSFTLEAWVNPTALPTSGNRKVIYYENINTPGATGRAEIGIANSVIGCSGTVFYFFFRADDSTINTICGTTTPAINAWYHVVGVFDSVTDVHYLYINGKVDASLSAVVSAVVNTSPAANDLGANSSGTAGFWSGRIDQMRIFNYGRSAAQIAWDYNKGGPVAWYKLDECQGTRANDFSGNGNVGTITIGASGTQPAAGTCETSSTAWGNGKVGKLNYSLNFDATDDYVDLGDNANLYFANSFTLSTWIKPSTGANGFTKYFLGDYNSGGTTSSYVLRLNGSNIVNFFWENPNGTAPMASSTTALAVGTWYHIVATWDGTTRKVYINGNLEGTDATAQSRSDNGGNSALGRAGSYTSSIFGGQMDDVRFFNYPLTATQIRTLYNNGAVNFGPVTGAP